jgi:adenylylsulfate kinase-like enzyme
MELIKKHVTITLSGQPASGKTAVAQQLETILTKLGAHVSDEDPDGRQAARPKAVLYGMNVTIKHVRETKSQTFRARP